MPITIQYQPSAQAVGGVAYQAGLGRYRKWQAEQEMQREQMRQRERMQQRDQQADFQRMMMQNQFNQQSQQRDMQFRGGQAELDREHRVGMMEREQEFREGNVLQGFENDQALIKQRAEQEKEVIRFRSEQALQQEQNQLQAQRDAVERSQATPDEKREMNRILDMRAAGVEKEMAMRAPPKPIAHLPETDQPGMPVLDAGGRTVGFRDRYGVPKEFKQEPRPSDPPSRADFTKNLLDYHQKLQSASETPVSLEQAAKAMAEAQRLYDQQFGGQQPPPPETKFVQADDPANKPLVQELQEKQASQEGIAPFLARQPSMAQQPPMEEPPLQQPQVTKVSQEAPQQPAPVTQNPVVRQSMQELAGSLQGQNRPIGKVSQQQAESLNALGINPSVFVKMPRAQQAIALQHAMEKDQLPVVKTKQDILNLRPGTRFVVEHKDGRREVRVR